MKRALLFLVALSAGGCGARPAAVVVTPVAEPVAPATAWTDRQWAVPSYGRDDIARLLRPGQRVRVAFVECDAAVARPAPLGANHPPFQHWGENVVEPGFRLACREGKDADLRSVPMDDIDPARFAKCATIEHVVVPPKTIHAIEAAIANDPGGAAIPPPGHSIWEATQERHVRVTEATADLNASFVVARVRVPEHQRGSYVVDCLGQDCAMSPAAPRAFVVEKVAAHVEIVDTRAFGFPLRPPVQTLASFSIAVPSENKDLADAMTKMTRDDPATTRRFSELLDRALEEAPHRSEIAMVLLVDVAVLALWANERDRFVTAMDRLDAIAGNRKTLPARRGVEAFTLLKEIAAGKLWMTDPCAGPQRFAIVLDH
jgi:hypothetical protein